ncbi:MAG TPA: hypothetical protein VEC57_08475 [Candidatus Limnocylindrales bacterium]|nr:hypothetical protein [Candidatus Limnocylindrales bacterium]
MAILSAAGVVLLAALPADAVQFIVRNDDSPAEGFNDITPVAPIGGNPGDTLGEQRMYVFQYAADAWGARLNGNIPIVVSATFDALGGTQTSALLGSASPDTVHRDFLNATRSGTWYAAALANQLANDDLNSILDPDRPEMSAQFNSSVDGPTVLGTRGFYYGLDGNNGSNIDFLSVVLHEIAHGVGFLDLIDPSTGSLFDPPPGGNPLPDAYTFWLEDPTVVPKSLVAMSDQQRKAAILNGPDLAWAGTAVKGNSAYLTQGRKPDGRVQIYAPAQYEPGSSVAHFDTKLAPDELMEPFATSGIRDLRLTVNLFKDLGYSTNHIARCGDANNDSAITSVDALSTLKSAVGSANCSDLVCDVNLSGAITAADALTTLKAAVGISLRLNCPLS